MKRQTYRVLYAVTRGEWYEVEARNKREAEERAFTDGALVEDGETTDVVCLEVEEGGAP